MNQDRGYAEIEIDNDGNTFLCTSGQMCNDHRDERDVIQENGASYGDDDRTQANGISRSGDHRTQTLSKPKKNKLHVSFGNLEVREYIQTLVDHPGTSYGPSIGLSWDHISAKTLDIEAHECYRILYSPRRVGKALAMPYHTRRNILQNDLHFSREEIEKASSEAALIQKQRLISYARIPLESVDEVMESLKRKVTRIVGRKHSQ